MNTDKQVVFGIAVLLVGMFGLVALLPVYPNYGGVGWGCPMAGYWGYRGYGVSGGYGFPLLSFFFGAVFLGVILFGIYLVWRILALPSK